MRAAALVLAALLAGIGVLPMSARAEDRRCKLDPNTGLLDCVLVAQPSPPKTVRLSKELPLVWQRVPFNVDEQIFRGHGCTRSNAGVDEVGAGYVITLLNEAT